MSNFPKVDNQTAFSSLLANSCTGIKNGNWLTREIRLVKKPSKFIRALKIFLNIFPGDRFSSIRVNQTAKGLAELCMQHRNWIDSTSANQACEILDELKTKTAKSKKRVLYQDEIELAKQKILDLVKKNIEPENPLDNQDSPPPPFVNSPKEKVIDKVTLKDENQILDFNHKIDCLIITGQISQEQVKDLQKAIEKKKIKRIVFSPEATLANAKLFQATKINPLVQTSVDPELSPDSTTFSITTPYSARCMSSCDIDKCLTELESKIHKIEKIDLGGSLNIEQEKKLANLILAAPNLTDFTISLVGACLTDILLPALLQKKNLETLSCLGDNSWIEAITQEPCLKIKNLYLCDIFSSLDDSIIERLTNLTELETIAFNDPAIFKNKIPTFVKTMKKMKKLNKIVLIRDRHFLSQLAEQADQNSKLPNLSLKYCEEAKPAFETLAKKNCTIDQVTFHFYLDSLSEILPFLAPLSLKQLDVKGSNLSFEDYKKLGEFKTIEKLSLSYPNEGGDQTIEKLLKALPNLKEVLFYPSCGEYITRHDQSHVSKIRIHGNSLLPHEKEKLQKLFPNLIIKSRRAAG